MLRGVLCTPAALATEHPQLEVPSSSHEDNDVCHCMYIELLTMETYGQEGIQIWQPEVRISMSIYLPQQSIILCSTIRSVEDNDGNDIRTYTTDIWLLQVRVINQEDLVMVINLLLLLCCDYCLI